MRILLGAIYPYAFLLLYLIIPFDNYIRALPNILLGILLVAFPFIVKKEDFQKLKSVPALLFFLFFLFLILNAGLFGRLETDFNIIKKVLIAVGLIILYIPVGDVGKMKRAITFSSLAAILFSIVSIVIGINGSGDLILEDYPKLIEMLLIDRLYLGFLGVLSILISFDSLKKEFHPENRYYLFNIIVNLLFLLLIASKIALIILLFTFILRQFYGRRNNIKIIAAVLLFSLVAAVFISVKEDIQNKKFLTVNTETETNFIKNSLTWDTRTVVWHCANIISREMGFSINGLGFKGSKDRLVECYDQKIEDNDKRARFMSARFNTHNQFIDFYLSSGIISLLIFAGTLLFLFLRGRKNFFVTALLLVLASYCFVENIFHRQLGAYFAGFIMICLLLQKREN
jgi:O-antigen ligase